MNILLFSNAVHKVKGPYKTFTVLIKSVAANIAFSDVQSDNSIAVSDANLIDDHRINPDPKGVKPLQVVSISHLQKFHDEMPSEIDVESEIDDLTSYKRVPRSFFTLSDESHDRRSEKVVETSHSESSDSETSESSDESENTTDSDSESEAERSIRKSTRESRKPSRFGDNIHDRLETTI